MAEDWTKFPPGFEEHYALLVGLNASPAERARFWPHVFPEPNTGCWLWAGPSDRRGYGVFRRDGDRMTLRPYRFLWEAMGREYPAGLILRHRCDTPACVNPDHLELGDRQDNMIDMALRRTPARGCVRLLPSGRHQARVRVRGVLVSLGTYPTEEEARFVAKRFKEVSFGRRR